MKDFPCLTWIITNIQEYDQGKIKKTGKRQIIFPKNLYSAALFHVYSGTLPINEIADRTGVSPEILHQWRTDLGFLLLVDSFKKECSDFLREKLLINDFTPYEYDAIGAEYSLLDEVVQNQIKVPLFNKMKTLAHQIHTRKKVGLPLDTYNLTFFVRLFTFFLFVEKHTRHTSEVFSQSIKPVAQDIVWPELKRDWGQVLSVLEDERLLGDMKVKELEAQMKRCVQ